MLSGPLLVSHVQFGEPSQCLPSRVGNLYQHTSTSFPGFPRPLLPRETPLNPSLHTWDPCGLLRESPAWVLSLLPPRPYVYRQLFQSVSLSSPFPTLTGVGETWFQTPLDPNEARRKVSVPEIPVKDPGEMRLCTFPSHDPLFLES